MFKIYGRPGAGNVAVEALLAECDAPHELITLKRKEGCLPESYRAINPMMQVPALVLPDGSIMTESAAIMIYLADMFPVKSLAPSISSSARARYLRWMVFMATNLYMTDLAYYYSERLSLDPAHAPAIKAKATVDMNCQFDILAGAIGEGPHVLGKAFSAADIYAAMLFTWSPEVDELAARHPNLKALHDHVASRPAIAPVWKRNGM